MDVLLKRIVVGLILILLFAGVFWLDWWMESAHLPRLYSAISGRDTVLRALPLTAMVALLIVAGYIELYRMSAAAGVPMFRTLGVFCAVTAGTLPFWRQVADGNPHGGFLTEVAVGSVVMVLFAGQIARYRTRQVVQRMGSTLLAVCYLGICGAVVLGIRMQFGLKALLLFLLCVKCTDIGAYFAGSAIGRHKIIPWLSPGKSWEGLAGGLALAAACAMAFAKIFNPVIVNSTAAGQAGTDITMPAAAALAVVLGLFGQGADLCESALKRSAGQKDAGSSIPAFGGVLDVMDSPLLAAPVGYVFLAMLG